MDKKKKISDIKKYENIVIAVLLILTIVWSVWPIIKCLSCVADYGRDGELIVWIINTAGKNLYGLHSGNVSQLFAANIFYPFTNVLAYSEMFFLSALWSYPLGILSNNPTVVTGMVLVAGQLSTMALMYYWWWKIAGNKWAALVAVCAFGLSAIRMEYQVHLQMWSMQYFLMASMWGVGYITDAKPKRYRLFLAAVMLGLQAWESLLPIVFGATVLISCAAAEGMRLKGRLWDIGVALILFSGVAAVPLWTYYSVSFEFKYLRSIRETAANGLSVDEIWTKFGSVGLYTLTGYAIYKLMKNRKADGEERRKLTVRWLAMVLTISIIMSLGPVLKWMGKTVKPGGIPVPLPYAGIYYTVPGFGAFRTPSRWFWLAGFAASGLVAMSLSDKKFSLKSVSLWSLLILTVIGGTNIKSVRMLQSPLDAPEVYKWLSKQPGEVILEMPIYADEREIERLVNRQTDNKRSINGFSGFYPPELAVWGSVVNAEFPSEKTTKKLKDMNVDYVVVDKKKGEEYRWRYEEASIPIYEDSGYSVYKI